MKPAKENEIKIKLITFYSTNKMQTIFFIGKIIIIMYLFSILIILSKRFDSNNKHSPFISTTGIELISLLFLWYSIHMHFVYVLMEKFRLKNLHLF